MKSLYLQYLLFVKLLPTKQITFTQKPCNKSYLGITTVLFNLLSQLISDFILFSCFHERNASCIRIYGLHMSLASMQDRFVA